MKQSRKDQFFVLRLCFTVRSCVLREAYFRQSLGNSSLCLVEWPMGYMVHMQLTFAFNGEHCKVPIMCIARPAGTCDQGQGWPS